MARKLKVLVSILVLLFFALPFAGCVKKEEGKVAKEEAIIVWVSILPQADLVKKIGGELVEVNVLIPKGVSPEDYELPPQKLKELSRADIYFMVGHLPLEKAWIEKIKANNRDLQVVDTSQGIEIIDDNPHIWLSPRLAVVQAYNIFEALSRIDKENKDYYEENYAALKDELEEMDKNMEALFSPLKTRLFITYHPAWTYLARDYRLTELSIEKHGKEPAARDIARIIDIARENGIKTVFVSPQHSEKSAQTIAKELGGEVKVIDPLPASYNELYEAARAIAQAMQEAEKNR